MKRLPRLALVTWSVVALGGCAAITGLDSIKEEACGTDCDAGVGGHDTSTGDVGSTGDDSTMPGPDTSTPQEAAIDATPDQTEDATPPRDASTDEASAATDAGTADTGVKETGTDAPPDVVVTDAPFDSGCGALNTTTNCSACGDKCAAASSSVSGNSCSGATDGVGATCSYTCATGYLDCNVGTAPDTDGCECHAPGATAAQCCAGLCPVSHDYDEDLIGTTFYDCAPQGTYSKSLAMDACTAYAGAGQCNVNFDYYCSFADGGLAGDMVCSDGNGAAACACWGYDDAVSGTMIIGPGKYSQNQNNCECPEPTDPKWK